MEKIFMNTQNSKTSEPHKARINMLLFKTCLFITPGKYKTTLQNNTLKIIAPTWNDEFELLDGSYSVSGIQDYISAS